MVVSGQKFSYYEQCLCNSEKKKKRKEKITGFYVLKSIAKIMGLRCQCVSSKLKEDTMRVLLNQDCERSEFQLVHMEESYDKVLAVWESRKQMSDEQGAAF